MTDATKPRCYNRPPFKDQFEVQDGYMAFANKGLGGKTRFPRIVTVPLAFEQKCMVNASGDAIKFNFDCKGCKWESTP